MILAVDIGNTNIVIGGIDKNKTYFVERLSSDRNKTILEYAIYFKTVLEIYNIHPSQIEGGIISSVVPPLSNVIKNSMEKTIDRQVLIIGPGLKTGLNILIDNPAQLGSDLVVDSVAAIHNYPTPAIVIDMGTATTISVIDEKHNYLGTVIIPGIKVSMDSLTSRTSQLPAISLEAPKRAIGKNTIEAMKSGAVFGNAAILDGMIDRIEEELGEHVKSIIATGGLAKYVLPHCKHKIIYEDDLLMKGLHILYEKNTN